MKRVLLPALVLIMSSWHGYSQCIESIPYTEDFSGTGWQLPVSDPGAGSIPSCWTRTSSSDFYWRPDQGATGTNNTGPGADHTTGFGKYVHAETDFSTNSSTSTGLLSPWIDLSTATSPELRYWRHMFGFQVNNILVQAQSLGGTGWTTLHNIGGQTHTSSTDPWTEGVADLSSFSGDTVRIRFVANRTTNFGQLCHIAIDDILVWESNGCSKPNSFNVQSKTQTSVTLGWSSTNTNGAVIRYLEVGQPMSSAVEVNVGTNNPATINSLLPSTTYLFWVRDSCGVGNLGPWEGPLSTTTVCGTITAPWSEGFEGPEFESPTAFNNPGSIHSCWVRSPSTSSNYMWFPGPPFFASFGSGPSSAHSGSKWVQSDRAGGGSGTSSYIRTPRIDLSGLTSPELRFWYHMYGANIQKLEVDVTTGTGGWTTIRTITGQQQTLAGEAWEEDAVSLSAYANQSVFVRFRAFNNGNVFQAVIAVDDISIDEAPPCPRPNPVTVTNVTDTEVTLTWTSPGTAPWQIEYGAPGFTPGTGAGTLVNATSNPFTVSTLSPQTPYHFYVRDTCGALGVSLWTGPIEVMTNCSPIAAPYTENFDGGTFQAGTFGNQGVFDPCWSASDETGDYYWTPSPPAFINTQSGPTSDNTTGTGGYLFTDGGFAALPNDTALVFSPLIDLSPLTVPELTFYYHMFGPQIHSMKLYVNDGSGWAMLWSKTGEQQFSGSDPWAKAVVDISAYAGSTIQLRFVGKRANILGNDHWMAIDDIDVHEQPACPQPTNLTFIGRTTTSVNLSWNTSSGSSWIIEYGPSNFPLGTGTQVTAGASPHNVTGLDPGTTYDFYVISDCGPDGLSEEEGPLTTNTLCGVTPAPFTENFEASGWKKAGFFPDVGKIEPCWVRSDTVAYIWLIENQEVFPTTSGPKGDHTTGSGKYIYTELRGVTPDNSFLQTPQIDLSPLDTPQLSFWYYMYGSDIDFLKLEVKEGTSAWTTLWTKTGTQQTSNNDAWREAIVDLTAYTNQTIRLRWVGKRTAGFANSEIALDDIRVDEKPQCPAPSDITATPVSETAVELNWTTGGATGWQVEYGPQNFIPGSGTTVFAPNNPFIVTGLNSNTPYDFYVSDSCSVGSYSWADGPATASTYPCSDACLYELILTDQFTNGWIAGGGGVLHYLDVIVAGTTTSYTLPSGNTITHMVPVCDGQSVELRFRNSGFFSNECGIEFKDPTGTTLYTRTPSTINLATGSLFTGTGSCVADCPDPVGLTIQNITANSAVAVWSSISGNSQIAYGSPGFTPTVPNQRNLGTSYSLTALSPNTPYHVYVRDTCLNGTVSQWVGPVSFTTLSCGPVTAGFTSTTNSLKVDLDGTSSSANVTTHTWYFGDGNTGGGAIATHTYSAPGIYDVSLVARNPCGDSDSTSSQVVVCGTPTAGFVINKLGLVINPDASSSIGVGMTYDWNYGDGNTGTGINPGYTYAAPGTFDITLIVTDTCGTKDTIVQSVTVCLAPLPSFSYTVTGFTVQFDAAASVNGTTYLWDFGDGNTGTGVSPSHTYTSNQNYNVSLRLVNSCGDTAAFNQTVALCSDPVASWTYTIISSGGSGMLVQFDATASVGTTFEWTFGDGGTASGTNFPTHVYLTPGLFYQVTLIVGNDCGEKDTSTFKLNQIGLTEWNSDDYRIYPNPTTGSFYVELPESFTEPIEVVILDLSGKVIETIPNVEFDSGEQRLLLESHAPSGSYLIKVRSDVGVLMKRIEIIR